MPSVGKDEAAFSTTMTVGHCELPSGGEWAITSKVGAPSGEGDLLDKGTAVTLSTPTLRGSGSGSTAHTEKGRYPTMRLWGRTGVDQHLSLDYRPPPTHTHPVLTWLTWVFNLNTSLRSYTEPG